MAQSALEQKPNLSNNPNGAFTRLKATILDIHKDSIVVQVEYPLESKRLTLPDFYFPVKLRKKGTNVWIVRNGKTATIEAKIS